MGAEKHRMIIEEWMRTDLRFCCIMCQSQKWHQWSIWCSYLIFLSRREIGEACCLIEILVALDHKEMDRIIERERGNPRGNKYYNTPIQYRNARDAAFPDCTQILRDVVLIVSSRTHTYTTETKMIRNSASIDSISPSSCNLILSPALICSRCRCLLRLLELCCCARVQSSLLIVSLPCFSSSTHCFSPFLVCQLFLSLISFKLCLHIMIRCQR